MHTTGNFLAIGRVYEYVCLTPFWIGHCINWHASVFIPANGKSPSSVTEYTWPKVLFASHSTVAHAMTKYSEAHIIAFERHAKKKYRTLVLIANKIQYNNELNFSLFFIYIMDIEWFLFFFTLICTVSCLQSNGGRIL